MSNTEVTGLGALNIDHLYHIESILEDGEVVVKEEKLFPGGSAANTIYGLARLGVKTGFAGVIGDDDEGKILLGDFEKAGVDTSQIKIKAGARSGAVLCLTDSSGKRSLYVSPGANNLLTIEDLDMSSINQAGVLHVSSFTDNRQLEMLVGMMERIEPSTKLSFSPGALYAARGLKALAPILERSHVLFLNQNEIRQLTVQDIVDGAGTCLREGCQMVVVTLGTGTELASSKGNGKKTNAVCYIRDTENEYIIEPTSRKTAGEIETTGAGDAFAAGFLYGLLKGKNPEECGRLGNIVAQFSIAEMGARTGLPSPDELSQRYQEIYNREL
jgi:ribokinase